MNFSENWHSSVDENIRFGLIEIWVLSMLKRKDMYAYQIKRELETRSGTALWIKDGSLYGPMYRMLERNLISSKREVVGEKRFRNYFHIEPSGEEYLAYSIERFYEIYGLTKEIISEYCSDKASDNE